MKIYDKKLFKEGIFWLAIISALLVLVIITDVFDLKKHSAFLFNTVWMYYLNIKTIVISLSEEKSREENKTRELAKIARKNVLGKKEPIVHILWIGLMIGSMPAVFYSLMLAMFMFLGGCGVLIWYIVVINDEIKRLKTNVEFYE